MIGKKRIIAENIRRFRTEANLTQEKLGLLLGYSEETAQTRLRQYESGERTPNAITLDKIASILKKPAGAFYVEGGQELPTLSSEPKQLTMKVHDEAEQEFLKLRREAEKYGKDVVEKIESYSRWMIEEAKKKKATRASGETTPTHSRMVHRRGKKANG